MAEIVTVTSPQKTAIFQMRINPEIKEQVEEIYAKCGLSLTDAVNIFIQQSINTEGLPFIVTQNTKEALKYQAMNVLMLELEKGEGSDWMPEEKILSEFGIKP